MAADVATIGVISGLILPVYAGLWRLNRTVGEIDARTEQNEKNVEHISEAVDSLSERATRVDARHKAAGSFSDSDT